MPTSADWAPHMEFMSLLSTLPTRQRVAAGESKVAIAKDLGVGRATLYRALPQ